MRAWIAARLDFGKLWLASAVSNVGDGVTMVAGPLLVAGLTQHPVLVAGAAFVQQLPWLLLVLVSGAYADRVDRRRLVVLVNFGRGVALAGLALAIAADTVSVPLIYLVFFVLGVGETFADTASVALLPAVVPKERLTSANAIMMATFTIGNQFVAKPLGAWLFVIAAALPFAADALTFLLAAGLIATLKQVPHRPEPKRTKVKTDIAEGITWLRNHSVLKALAVTMGVANVVFCAAFAIFVLYAEQRLDLDEVGYGLLLTTFAAGGFVGTAAAARLRKKIKDGTLLRTGLVIETATHLTLAITDDWRVAAVILVIFGVHTMVWGVIAVTIRQEVVPSGLLGRATSVYSLLVFGGAAIGSPLGGLFAQGFGITAPFWIAAGVMVLVSVAAWRPLREA